MAISVVYSENAPEPIGPYSQAILAGNMLFVSGQIAIQKASGKIITATIEEETKQVMENLKAILGNHFYLRQCRDNCTINLI